MLLKFFLFSVVGFYLCVFIPVAIAVPPNNVCDLPKDLQHEIATKYSGTKIVNRADLAEADMGFFQKDHGNTCPGLVDVDFYGDGRPTLALVLISEDEKKKKAKLVVAHKVGTNWKTALLDTVDSSVPVVWSQGPGEYQDVYGKKKIRATGSVIVFCGYESWMILYAWTNGTVTKVWLMD